MDFKKVIDIEHKTCFFCCKIKFKINTHEGLTKKINEKCVSWKAMHGFQNSFVPNKFIFNSNFILSFWRILIHGWIMWPLSYTYLFDLTCRAERQGKREGERVCQIEFSDLQVHTPNAHNMWSCSQPKLGTWNSTQVSHVGRREPRLGSLSTVSQGICSGAARTQRALLHGTETTHDILITVPNAHPCYVFKISFDIRCGNFLSRNLFLKFILPIF